MSTCYPPGFEYVSMVSTDIGAWNQGTVGQEFYVYASFDQESGSNKMGLYQIMVHIN
jgi:hypothetical protein